MQRYGYEGYPVMEKGKVVGLLTRRAVDRALGHHLKASVGDVMEAGSVTITPDQPVDQVRRLMTSSGWGQIPVVDAGGKLVGIVTRTDVIRVPGGESASLTQNLTTRMEAALPPARLALLKAVAEEGARQHMALYIVGGFVRDLLLDRPGVDVDLVVEGDAIALGKALKKTYGGKIITHERFGTAKWLVGEMAERLAAKLSKAFDLEISETDLPESLDLVSARREFYSEPSALPTVERGSIKLDLHRRDFPINTLALRLDGRYYGELHDHWGGLNDLEDGRIRVLHSLSFVDDPTRILRAVRYEQRYGFEIEARTLELLVNALPLLERVSGDRVRHEISAMLLEEKGTAMLSRLDELGILNAIHPELPWDKTARERLAAALKTHEGELWELEANLEGMPAQVALAYLTWLLALPSVGGASIAGRLRLPGWLTKAILAAARMYPERDGLKKKQASEVTAVLDEMPLLAVYGLWLVVPNGKIRDRLHQYATEWRYVHPKTDGHALRELGVPQGPRYKQMLDRLRAAWLDGEVKDAAGEQQLLESLLEHSR
jgi:tRNA nucleotidyltransferase (CCA-adding enzyme)